MEKVIVGRDVVVEDMMEEWWLGSERLGGRWLKRWERVLVVVFDLVVVLGSVYDGVGGGVVVVLFLMFGRWWWFWFMWVEEEVI